MRRHPCGTPLTGYWQLRLLCSELLRQIPLTPTGIYFWRGPESVILRNVVRTIAGTPDEHRNQVGMMKLEFISTFSGTACIGDLICPRQASCHVFVKTTSVICMVNVAAYKGNVTSASIPRYSANHIYRLQVT
ncbi:hypothetical protein PV11_03939 [Exophiala sideris]|uniref:Uncharacterized protein n=1 Tax=Exophiala sideris TaxID=1016849 RepID=A0A0D1YL24_9EURO|nr:hypothetical protein PV11_03939 [Exophiala sideris]